MAGCLCCFDSSLQEDRQCDQLSVGLLRKNRISGICVNGVPEAAAALKIVLLLLFGEAEFGIECVLWTCEGAERCCEGSAHLERVSGLWIPFGCYLVVEKSWVCCVESREKENVRIRRKG